MRIRCGTPGPRPFPGSRLYWVIAFLVAAAAPLAGQAPAIDPVLQRLMDPQQAVRLQEYGRIRPDAPATEVPLGGSIALDTGPDGTTRVGVLLDIGSPAVLQRLRELGVDVGSVVGDLVTARVPIALLPAVAALPVRRMQAARMLRLLHDSSMVAIGADRVRQRGGDGAGDGWIGTTGAGALVGIVDTGIDILHPDFHDDAGLTRVAALWDQLSAGTPPPVFGYGLYCTRERIQLVITGSDPSACPTQDLNGHGTHVAGTAAGDGSAGATPYRYAGVAPEAELLIVKAGNGTFSEDRVIDGLVWIRDEARSRGRPAVVNLSLGHQYGPHDGSTFFERVIDSLAGPGFLVVLAAGNDGANMNLTGGPPGPPALIHARVQPVIGQTSTVEFVVSSYTPNPGPCDANFIQLSVWYDVRDRIELTVTRPNGSQHTVPAGTRSTSDDAQGRIEIYNAFPLSAYPGTAEALIEINGCPPSGVPAPGTWRVGVRPQPATSLSGDPVDLYLHTVFLGRSGTATGTTGFDNRFLIGSPGGATRGITVGAFVTRVCWPSRAAPTICYTPPPTVGDLAIFSAAGPTRDGRIKPEIVAPGAGIMSSLSRHTGAPAARVSPDGMHWVLEGTSMAAPHVAGAVALMLQHRPALGPEDALDVLARSARQDEFTRRIYDTAAGAEPRDWWGYGKLDVAAALELLLGGGAVTSVVLTPAVDTIPAGGTMQLRAAAADPVGNPVFASFTWISLDTTVATVTQTGAVRGVRPGNARIVAVSGDAADTAIVVVQPPAVLAVSGRSEAPATPLPGRAGALLPLLSLRLEASGPEAIQVESLTFAVTGADPAATLLLLDLPAGTVPDSTARVVGRVEAELTAEPRNVTIPLDTFTVRRNTARELVLAVRLSGAAPTGSAFSARLLPGLTRTVNLNSRARDRVAEAQPVASAPAVTTVLREGEVFALSENPVRQGHVIFNFSEPPTAAAVYTATGSRVIDLAPRLDGLSYRWDLTNDAGAAIVPGVYLVVVRIGGETIRQRLIVLWPQAGGRP